MVRKPSRRLSRDTAHAIRLATTARVGIEPLESRMLLSSVVVNSISDTDAAGTVTLRDAVAIANSSTSPTTITFDPTVFAVAQTITLGGTQLELSNTAEPTTITGPSAGVTISGAGSSRVFLVDSAVSLTLQSVSIANGLVSGISATPNSPGLGGGVDVVEGTLIMSNGSITGNSGTYGGGIGDYGGIVTLTNVTLSNNAATLGGAIDSGSFTPGFDTSGAVLTLNDSTVSDNTAESAGGGITNYYGNDVLINSTIADNTEHNVGVTSSNGGGGVVEFDGVATIDDSTIIGNTAGGSLGGGGVIQKESVVQIANSIVAANTSTIGGGPDISGAFSSQGHNLIGETDDSTGWVNSDLTGTSTSPLSAGVGSLANNGGPTETFLPLSGSRAIASGSVALIPSGVTTDQRGDARTINGAVDIGAVEVGGPAVSTVASVTTIAASAHTQVVGQADTFTVSVASASGSGAVPTGTVTISRDGTALGTYALTDGQVSETYTVPAQSAGNVYTAVYSGDTSYAASTSSGVTEVYLPASVAAARITKSTVPTSAIAGQKYIAKVPVVLTNSGAILSGTFSATLFADAAGTGLDSTPVRIGTLAKRATVKTGHTLPLTLSAKTLPSSLPAGTYHLVVEVADPDGGYDLVTTAQTVTVAAPFVALTATAGAVKPATIAVNKSGSITITLTNTGNVNATGAFSVVVSPSVDGITSYPGVSFTLSKPLVTLKPNKPTKYTVHLKIPAALPAGLYFTDALITLDGVTTTAIGSQFTAG